MKEFIEKLIDRLEELDFGNSCSDCLYRKSCEEYREKYKPNENYDLCGLVAKRKAIEIVNQLAEEYEQTIDVAELVEMLGEEDVRTNNGWISCKERLPEEKGEYLVCDDDGKIHESTYYHNMWLVQSTTSEILAWMPLPTPYKESEEE